MAKPLSGAPVRDVPSDKSESDVDGPAPPVPGIDAAAPADASLAGEAGLPDKPAGADGGAVGSLDAISHAGAIDGGIDAPAAASKGDDGGCGCHLAARGQRRPGKWAVALVVCAALLMRRRRR